MEYKELTTQRLILRQVQQADAPFVLEGLSNDELTKFMLIHYYTLEQVQQQMDYYANQHKNKTGFYWLMELKEIKESVGVIGINNISVEHKKAEIGFWLLPSFGRKGYTTEAAKTVTDFCFDSLGLNRIEATVETENIASIKSIQQLNFVHEGTFREYEWNNRKFIDLMMFALLKGDR